MALSNNEIRFGTAFALQVHESNSHFSREVSVSTRAVFLNSAILFPLLFSAPVQAQRVTAEIRIGGGPVSGHIILGDVRRRYESRPRAIRQVEWIRGGDRRRDDWFRRFGRQAQVVIVFYDRDDDRYYFDRYRSGLQEIRIYERDGRFYRFEDDRYGRHDDRWSDRRDHRWSDRRDDRWDDRRDDRWDNKRDDKRDKRRNDRHQDYRDHRGER
jgi:hypothetical protein